MQIILLFFDWSEAILTVLLSCYTYNSIGNIKNITEPFCVKRNRVSGNHTPPYCLPLYP